jgi:hypothetical protein
VRINRPLLEAAGKTAAWRRNVYSSLEHPFLFSSELSEKLAFRSIPKNLK